MSSAQEATIHTVKDLFDRTVAVITVEKDERGLLWAKGPYHYVSYLHGTEEYGNINPQSKVLAYNFDPNKLRGTNPFTSSPHFYGTTMIFKHGGNEIRNPFIIINYDNKGLLHGISEIHFLNLEECRKTQATCLAFPDGTYGIRETYSHGKRVDNGF